MSRNYIILVSSLWLSDYLLPPANFSDQHKQNNILGSASRLTQFKQFLPLALHLHLVIVDCQIIIHFTHCLWSIHSLYLSQIDDTQEASHFHQEGGLTLSLAVPVSWTTLTRPCSHFCPPAVEFILPPPPDSREQTSYFPIHFGGFIKWRTRPLPQFPRGELGSFDCLPPIFLLHFHFHPLFSRLAIEEPLFTIRKKCSIHSCLDDDEFLKKIEVEEKSLKCRNCEFLEFEVENP